MSKVVIPNLFTCQGLVKNPFLKVKIHSQGSQKDFNRIKIIVSKSSKKTECKSKLEMCSLVILAWYQLLKCSNFCDNNIMMYSSILYNCG